MAAFTITRQGSILKAVDSGGDVRVFTTPSIRLYPNAAYPSVQYPCIEIRQGDANVLQLQVADIVSINGVLAATIGATLPPFVDALAAIPAGNLSVQTSATGTTAVAFGSQICSQLTVFNGTGTAIDVLQGATAVTVPTGTSFTFVGLSNANQLSVRRTDQTNVQVTIGARWQA